MNDERQAIAELLRELFLMLRELMPTTQDNTQRQTEFATRLQAYLEGRATNEGT
jgi:hypothetical protein